MSNTRRRRRWESPGWGSAGSARLALGIIGIALAGFLIGYVLIAVFVFRGSNRPAVVSVPELRELPSEDARRRLEGLGLVMVIGDSLPNPEVTEGAVLAQSPLAGREVLLGSGVRVILSAGRERRTVADVSAMRREQATRMLEALGFTVVVVEESAPLAAGRVIGTQPGPGTVVPIPAEVRLTVSSGPPLAAVPDVVGLLEDDARNALESMGFRVAEVGYEFRATDTGLVVRQSPLPGDSARIGSGVQLRVATDRWDPDLQ